MKRGLISIGLSLLIAGNALGWNDTVTHKTLSATAAEPFFGSDFMLLQIKGKRARTWIEDGAELEDKGSKLQFATGKARSLNHFHKPTKLLADAGLTDFTVYNGMSAILWAQDGGAQLDKPEGDWSWQTIRDYYHKNLIATNEAMEEQNLANLLRGLGHQMHLLQDMSQPEHVRNNTHMIDGGGYSGFETWAANNNKIIKKKILTSIPGVSVNLTVPFPGDPSLSPVANLSDTRRYFASQTPSVSYDQGLSEYTNANFFSHQTIFAHERFADKPDYKFYSPYPRAASTNLQDYIDRKLAPVAATNIDGKAVKPKIWIKKAGDGETVDHMLREGTFSRFWQRAAGVGNRFYNSFKIDEICYKDYAAKLLPRTVGYSSAMLEYFFRGDIQIALPDSGAYGTAASSGLFTEIRLKAANITATQEEMSDGQIQLSVNYTVGTNQPISYIVVLEKTGKRSIPRGAPTELVFDLPTPIPVNATNLEMRVVYRGKLGNQQDEIAVGSKDVSEPTPVDVFNNTDYTCINGTWYQSGSHAALTAADANKDKKADSDIYPHDISDIAFKAGPVGNAPVASPLINNFFSATALTPGQFRRLGYILTDYTFRYAIYETRTARSKKDTFNVPPYSKEYPGQAVKNDQTNSGQMYTMRGNQMWWGSGVIFDNPKYPPTSSCDWALLP